MLNIESVNYFFNSNLRKP